MPLLIVTQDGAEMELEGEAGSSVMEVIRDADVDALAALCGGSCWCVACHVYIDEEFLDHLTPMGGEEDELLNSSPHRKPSSRLACQIRYSHLLDGLCVTVAPDS